tara:strand:- start:332 stop:1351 length:1020 start_codon:yes stop_codon:yes gene_type:complete
MTFNSDSNILITGGTGSFGKAFIAKVLDEFPKIQRIVIYSRDELKQWELQQKYPQESFPQLRFFLGDIRDKERLKVAFEDVDTVIHAAALKQVPAAEYNPIEFIKTNVIGAENIVRASLETNVKRIVALSTDKAAAPINLYGATKLCSDKLFTAANNIKGKRSLKISVVRYGNVMGSRGSVIPYFINQAQTGVIPITDSRMTRFNISLEESIEMVLWALQNAMGGELFVPKIPSYRITDIAEAIAPTCKKEIIGIRPGEKIHEEMITCADSLNTIDLKKYYAILPSDGILKKKYMNAKINYEEVSSNFSYNSGNNIDFLTIEKIRALIIKHINPNFIPL